MSIITISNKPCQFRNTDFWADDIYGDEYSTRKGINQEIVISIGYSIPGHSIWKRMPWGEAEMHSFSYTNDHAGIV